MAEDIVAKDEAKFLFLWRHDVAFAWASAVDVLVRAVRESVLLG